MIKLIFISVQVIGLIVSFAVLYKISKHRPPCDSCEYLSHKGQNGFGYRCDGPYQVSGSFSEAPTYCKYYKPRMDNDERKT